MKEWIFIHWILSSILVYVLIHGTINLVARLIRMLNIAFRGWPPAHLDGYGDWKPEIKEENNES